MKKFLILILIVCVTISCAIAEQEAPEYHYPFGLTDSATSEEIRSVLESIFKKEFKPSSISPKELVIIPDNKSLLNVPVSMVYYLPPDDLGWHYISITLDSEEMDAGKLLNIYNELTSAYGSPEIAYAKSAEIDLLSGKKIIDIPIENKEVIQQAFDQYNLNCFFSWGNVSVECSSSCYDFMGQTHYTKRTEIYYALTDESLKFEVKQYFGLVGRSAEQ